MQSCVLSFICPSPHSPRNLTPSLNLTPQQPCEGSIFLFSFYSLRGRGLVSLRRCPKECQWQGDKSSKGRAAGQGEDGGNPGGWRQTRKRGGSGMASDRGRGRGLLPLSTGSQRGTFLEPQGAKSGVRDCVSWPNDGPGWSSPWHLKGLLAGSLLHPAKHTLTLVPGPPQVART